MLKLNKYIFVLFPVAIFSQNIATVQYEIKESCYKFSIVGLWRNADDDSFRKETKNYPKKGIFIVKTDDKFPLPYSFVCEDEDGLIKQSRLFTVSSGDQLKFDIKSIVPNNQYFSNLNQKNIFIEDQSQFYKAFSDIEKLYSENDIEYKSNLIQYLESLEEYSKQYPNSYMLFWSTMIFFEENSWLTGFNEGYLKIFNNLSPTIQNSKYGNIFYQKIINSSKIKDGTRFPQIKLEGEKEYLLGSKFTLIDFWASYCKPCLEVFPAYKILYNQYKNKGFDIIGISVDRPQDMDKWKKIIKDRQLNWQQYIDLAGRESEKYNITAFPTTFLLDAEGTIIKREITPEELSIFLEENLKNQEEMIMQN